MCLVLFTFQLIYEKLCLNHLQVYFVENKLPSRKVFFPYQISFRRRVVDYTKSNPAIHQYSKIIDYQ